MAVDTYYFDASIEGPSDPGNVWFDDINAFDANENTFASVVYPNGGSSSSNYLQGKGTTAPISDNPISQVRFRVRYDDGSSGLWTSYVDLTPPSGGWTFDKANKLEVKAWYNTALDIGTATIYTEGELDTVGSVNFSSSPGDSTVYLGKIEIEVTSSSYSASASPSASPSPSASESSSASPSMSPSSSLSPSASASSSPSPQFTPTQSNVVASKQQDNLTITKAPTVDLTIID